MPDAQLSPASYVDIVAAADGALTVRWIEAPGHRARTITIEERAHIDALAEAVCAVESQRAGDPDAIEHARLLLGQALYAVLDGPERVLAQRLADGAQPTALSALAIRLRGALEHEPAGLARHPAVHWRWELLADARGPLSARHGGLAITVQLGSAAPAAPRTFELGGLRILFMAYSPSGTRPVLDYEREEEHILDAVSEFVRDGRARLRVVEHGSLDALQRCVLSRPYDVVHLSGHGVLTPQGPRLLMEDDVGDCHAVSPEELMRVLRRAGHMPEVVMISSCHSAGSRDGMPSLAAQLVAHGVPTVIGWAQPVRDDLATTTAADIYQRLCTGTTTTQAVAFARQQLHEADRRAQPEQRSHTWGTLRVFTCLASDVQVDEQRPPLADEPVDHYEAHAHLSEAGLHVPAHGFVGRRRELQRLISILGRCQDRGQDRGHGRDPRCAGAMIVGAKGEGKSWLVARALQRVAQELDDPALLGQIVLGRDLHDATVLEQFEHQALRWNDKQAEALLGDAGEPLLRRVQRLLASHWKRRHLVFVLDGFEQHLDPRPETPTSPERPALVRADAAALLGVFVSACRTTAAKLLVTTTARFALDARDADALAEIKLGALEPASIRKLWTRGLAPDDAHAPHAGPAAG